MAHPFGRFASKNLEGFDLVVFELAIFELAIFDLANRDETAKGRGRGMCQANKVQKHGG